MMGVLRKLAQRRSRRFDLSSSGGKSMSLGSSVGKLRIGIDSAASLAEFALWWARERISSPVVFNPFAKSLREDPFPIYRGLRERDPIH